MAIKQLRLELLVKLKVIKQPKRELKQPIKLRVLPLLFQQHHIQFFLQVFQQGRIRHECRIQF